MFHPSGRLVRIFDKGERLPLVMCHAVAGTVYFYYGLHRTGALKGPLWAVQALGLEQGEDPLGSIEELAARNLELLGKEADPESVHIGGYSFGAFVALEMARQLEVVGRRPRPLLMLAPSAPTPFSATTLALDLEESIEQQTQSLLKLALRGMDRLVPRKFKERLERMYRTHLMAFHSHIPVPIMAEIAAFVPLNELEEDRPEILRYWRTMSKSSCALYDVPGSHKSMIQPPYARALVDAIEEALRRSEK